MAWSVATQGDVQTLCEERTWFDAGKQRSRISTTERPRGRAATKTEQGATWTSHPNLPASFFFVCLRVCPHHPGSIRQEAQPVLNVYYNQAQSRQHPKRGTSQYSTCTTIIHHPGSIRKEAQPVLNLYYLLHPRGQIRKRSTASTQLVLQSFIIQAASETRHNQYSTCTTIIHHRGQPPRSQFRMGNLPASQKSRFRMRMGTTSSA